MKILITSDWNDLAVNGVATSVKNLRRSLEERGHEVRVLTLSQSRRSWQRDGVMYLGSLPVGRIYPGARLLTALAGKWVREIIGWKPDIVHSQCEFSTFFLARRIADELDIPLVHTYHTVYEDYTHYFSPSRRLGKKAVATLSRRIAAMTDDMIVPTEKVRRLLLGYGVRTPIHVVPSGIDLGRFRGSPCGEFAREQREKLGIPQERKILVYVGRLAEEKNLEEMLRFRANMGGDSITLLIVGGGPWKERLENTAAQLGLQAPDVVFAGMVPPETVASWYRMGDLFVSASTSETQGLTYIEAAANGLPLLCRQDDCLADVLQEGENGYEYTSAEEFLHAIDAVMDDPEWRAAAAKRSEEIAASFDKKNFGEAIEMVYESVL